MVVLAPDAHLGGLAEDVVFVQRLDNDLEFRFAVRRDADWQAALASGAFSNLKTATEAVAKIQVGQEVGLTPALALSQVYLVGGVPSFSVHFITAAIKRSRPRYDYRVKVLNREKCVGDWYQDGEIIGPDYEWGVEDAKAAGLRDKKGGMWDKYRKSMIFARWATSGARIYCPDILNATQIYTPDELGDKPAQEDIPQDAEFTVKREG